MNNFRNTFNAHLIPRLIRVRDAPNYLGMDRNNFNTKVRPHLTEIPLSKQAIAFDRLEIDAWIEHYVSCNGRRPKVSQLEDDACLNQEINYQDSVLDAVSGKSKNAVVISKEAGSGKAREHLAALKQKNI